jgi:tripartite-type tricarboxylate transporter receptor subunit TctC
MRFATSPAVRRFVCLVAIAAAAGGDSAAAADTAALKGKTIRAVIGSQAGGVGDAVARLYFKGMADALPDTTVRVQNLQGAGGSRAIKEVQEASGTSVTLGFSSNGPLYTDILTPDKSVYGRLAVKWVGSFMIGQRVLVARPGLGVRTLDDLKSRAGQTKFGAGEAGDATTVDSYMLNAITGLGARIVPGMEPPQLTALLLAGDIDVAILGSTTLADHLRAGALVPLLKYTDDARPDFLQAVPSLTGVGGEPKAREVLAMMQTLVRMRNLVFAAPNTDKATLDALRSVFDVVAAEPAFLAQAAKFDVSEPTPGVALDEALNGPGAEASGRLLSIGEAARFYHQCGTKMSDAAVKSCP